MTNPAKIIILRGYPGSGKTTWAGLNYPEAARISRDDLRTSRYGVQGKTALDNKKEQEISKLQEDLVKAYIAAGKSVVIDDTNLKARYARRWVDLAEALGVNWEVDDLLVDADTCIVQDSYRIAPVGEKVIRNYARRFPLGRWPEIQPSPKAKHKFSRYEPNTSNPTAYVFDIDGTLADLSHRNPYSTDLYHKDSPFHNVVDLAVELSENHNIIFLSGRSENFRAVTEEWLYEHVGFNLPLFMRPSGDTRNDGIVKDELFDKHVGPFYWVKGVFDDRLRVARVWHAKGLTLFRVGDPDADF